MVLAADVRPGDLVVEIGAGDGALTVPLAQAGARVIAIELHPGRAERLRSRVAGLDVRVVEMDAIDFRYPRRHLRVVANPPFGLASTLIRAAVGQTGVASIDLVLPRSVAMRWVDQASRTTRRFYVEVGISVPRRAFSPPPRVDCLLLQLRRR